MKGGIFMATYTWRAVCQLCGKKGSSCVSAKPNELPSGINPATYYQENTHYDKSPDGKHRWFLQRE